MLIRCEVARILIRETQDMHVVELREADVPDDQARRFPIVIGLVEAGAIERRIMRHTPPRPQTHELLQTTIETLGGKLEKIVVYDLKEGTFYAKIHLRQGEDSFEIDCRPSDAIALGATSDSPIFVEENVIEEICKQSETDS